MTIGCFLNPGTFSQCIFPSDTQEIPFFSEYTNTQANLFLSGCIIYVLYNYIHLTLTVYEGKGGGGGSWSPILIILSNFPERFWFSISKILLIIIHYRNSVFKLSLHLDLFQPILKVENIILLLVKIRL